MAKFDIMRPLLSATLFSSYVSALVLQPLITPAPRLAERDAAENVCGYYSLNGLGMLARRPFIIQSSG